MISYEFVMNTEYLEDVPYKTLKNVALLENQIDKDFLKIQVLALLIT